MAEQDVGLNFENPVFKYLVATEQLLKYIRKDPALTHEEVAREYVAAVKEYRELAETEGGLDPLQAKRINKRLKFLGINSKTLKPKG